MKVLVEYEIAPVRHLVIQCPSCGKYFYAKDILRYYDDGSAVRLQYKDDVDALHSNLEDETYSFECPMCGYEYEPTVDSVTIVETSYNKMPQPMSKKIVWE